MVDWLILMTRGDIDFSILIFFCSGALLTKENKSQMQENLKCSTL